MSGRVCQVHRAHLPRLVGSVDVHHAWPKGMGGPDESGNRIDVCSNGHRNIHAILAAFVTGAPMPGGTRVERRVARDGYMRWVAAGRPGGPQSAYGLTGDNRRG